MIFFILLVIVISIMFGLILSAPDGDNNPEVKKRRAYKTITPIEAKGSIDTDSSVIILDVQSKNEYEEKHIPNAINIPMETLAKDANQKLPDIKAKIIIYCKKGLRSKKAAELLASMGYESIYLLGGLQNWPYQTVKQ